MLRDEPSEKPVSIGHAYMELSAQYERLREAAQAVADTPVVVHPGHEDYSALFGAIRTLRAALNESEET